MLGGNEFVGSATRLADADFQRAAAQLGCEVAAIRAVAKVESGGRASCSSRAGFIT